MSVPPTGPRLLSLDAFRGATIAAMIVVNNPGAGRQAYAPLRHAAWHGCTPTDLIFPFFLFIVGVSLTLSRRTTWAEALRRAAALVALGLAMAAFPAFQLATLRWPGVLQRIGVCYLAAFALQRWLRPRALAAIGALVLVLYWALLTLVPLPDGTPPNLDPGTNLAAWVDRALMGGHLWRQAKTWDPEGVLSTLPAIVTTLIGVLAGQRLRAADPARVGREWTAAGLALTLAGLAWARVFPFNKALWTSSYVLFSGGLALLALAASYTLIDRLGWRAWSRPCVTFGRNAVFAFVASGMAAKLLARARLADGSALQPWLHARLFESWLAPQPASLAWALAHLAFWYVVLRVMERRGIFVKV
jgi:predicted acyltransferase